MLARRAGVSLDAQFESWARRVAALAAAGVELSAQRLCFGFGRPFGYYDGFLFEVRSAALAADAPVAAGGRYDGLLGRLQPERSHGGRLHGAAGPRLGGGMSAAHPGPALQGPPQGAGRALAGRLRPAAELRRARLQRQPPGLDGIEVRLLPCRRDRHRPGLGRDPSRA
jgi:ATP phosphoribosyltransferase regulatory subunit HisZ